MVWNAGYMVARVLGAAPVLADAIIDQLAAPSDKATDAGMALACRMLELTLDFRPHPPRATFLVCPHLVFWAGNFIVSKVTYQKHLFKFHKHLKSAQVEPMSRKYTVQ